MIMVPAFELQSGIFLFCAFAVWAVLTVCAGERQFWHLMTSPTHLKAMLHSMHSARVR
jgi:hypothetical protein